jgi:carbon-monoxide dehydrogenase medium subunit
LLAGGTDLLLQIKKGKISPGHLVSVRRLPGLASIHQHADHITIGANVTHRQVETSGLIASSLGSLSDACGKVGSVQVRNVATIVGNVCNAVPSCDTACPLLVHGAVVKATGRAGDRTIPLDSFFVGPGRTTLDPDEIVTAIAVPVPPPGTGSAYVKHSRRRAMDLALVGVAAYIEYGDERIARARIALGTAAPTPIRAYGAEESLLGDVPSEQAFKDAASIAVGEASPRSSYRSTAQYRSEMIRVLVEHALQTALLRARRSISQAGGLDAL